MDPISVSTTYNQCQGTNLNHSGTVWGKEFDCMGKLLLGKLLLGKLVIEEIVVGEIGCWGKLVIGEIGCRGNCCWGRCLGGSCDWGSNLTPN